MIIVGYILLWYCFGIIGSCIAFSSVDKKVYYPERGDFIFGLVLSLLGVCNLIAALIYSISNRRGIGFSIRWIKTYFKEE